MGRPKGSKNKPKPLPPDAQAALNWAKRAGVDLSAPPADPEEDVTGTVPVPADFREFLRIVKIRVKQGGKLVHPVLNDEQEDLLAAWEAGDTEATRRHMLVLKPRKIGVSTFFALLFVHKFLTADEPVTLVSLANRTAVAVEIMQMVKTAIFSLPPEMQPRLKTNQGRKLVRVHPENPRMDGATYFVDTARAERPLGGFTPFWLHVSEAAHVKDPDELRSAAFSSVPWESGGRIVLESTAKGIGDLLHQEIKRQQAGATEVPWQVTFFPWFKHKKYRGRVTKAFKRTDVEQQLAERFDLDDEQLAWRRTQITMVGERFFPREFPADVEDAYSSIAGQWMSRDQVAGLEVLAANEEGITIFEHPQPGEYYAAALDAGAGVGADATSLVIWNVRTKKPALLWRSRFTPPTSGVDIVWPLLVQYNNAKILVERNFWGIPYLDGLRALRADLYQEQTHEYDGQAAPSGEPRDFWSTPKARVEVLENLRTEIIQGAVTTVDQFLRDEVLSAVVDKTGKIVFPRTVKEGHGDVAFAYALVLRCARQVVIPLPPPPGPSPIQQRMWDRARARANPGARY